MPPAARTKAASKRGPRRSNSPRRHCNNSSKHHRIINNRISRISNRKIRSSKAISRMPTGSRTNNNRTTRPASHLMIKTRIVRIRILTTTNSQASPKTIKKNSRLNNNS